MKKIISLLSVFAMIATLFTTVAFADDNNKIYWEEVEKTETSLTLKLVLETDQMIASSTGSFDLTDAISKGLTNITGESIEAATWNPNISKSVIAYSYTNVDGGTGIIELGTVTFDLSTVTDSFTLPAKKAFTAKDTDKVAVINSFTNTAIGYTIEAPAGEELPADRTAAVKFAADENTFVEITKGAEVKNYFLPAGVKGDATVYGLLKYTVDGTNVASGDIFTIKAVDMETKTATDVATITVE